MGKISTSKLDNGNIGLEIVYGGPEAPFGGIDASAPPMYIDPLSFADASNFLVLSNTLIAFRWQQGQVTFGDWPAGGKYLDSGKFYQQGQYWNWTLAVVPGSPTGSPPTITNTFYIWVWPPTWYGNSAQNPITQKASCSVVQAQVQQTGGAATATLAVTSNSSATGQYTISASDPNHVLGPHVTNIAVTSGQSEATIAANVIAGINADSAAFFTASTNVNGANLITLTSKTLGPNGNTIQVAIASSGGIPALVMTSAFSGGGAGTGGSANYGLYPHPVSYVNIGETLYIGGYGTTILQYSQQDGSIVFGPLTSYLGAVVLGKYNNMLIAVGVVPGPGTVIQAPEMVLAWSASGQFGIWNPLDSNNNPTGAGFNQFADISNYLTGIFISPGQAVILRTHGIDYITPLSGGASPFDFAHISNALLGEGCQDMRLQCQYDQLGMFIGNTNVYQFAGQLSPVGDKIKDRLLADVQYIGADSRDSCAAPIYQGLFRNRAHTLFLFVLKNTIYIFNANNNTWMIFPLPASSTLEYDLEALCYSPGINSAQQPFYQFWATFNPFLIIQDTSIGPAPTYWHLDPWVQDATFPYAQPSFVLWPMEEISHGRDITIDGLLVNLTGTPGLVLNWSVSGILQGTLTLPTGSNIGFQSYQVFFGSTGPSGAGVTTIRDPQLRLDLPVATAGTNQQLSIAKISMFGSFDPRQRPV